MTKRKAQTGQFLEHRHLDDDVLEMMDNTTVCLNCGTSLKNNLDKEKRRNRGYCCLDCYYSKPPKFAFVEQITGEPILDYILNHLNNCDNISKVAELVGVQRQTLAKFLQKHGVERKVEWRNINETNKNIIKHR